MSDIEQIKNRVSELQQRLGVQLQVSIYNSELSGVSSTGAENDRLDEAAVQCRMSKVLGADATYAVRVVAEGIGEIPYALMCEETYVEGDSANEH